RNELTAAATRVIVAQGLSAPTAVIAKEAGISNGSLFTYFKTKAELFNELYLELKTEMATASLRGLPAKAPLREQFAGMWLNWMRWATKSPEERRALALLGVSDDITPRPRAGGHHAMAENHRHARSRARQRADEERADALRRRDDELGRGGDDGFHRERPGACRRARQGRVRGALAHGGRVGFFT